MKRICQWPVDHVLPDPARLLAHSLELDPEPPLPFGWEKCFDLQTGVIFFKDSSTGARTSKDPRVRRHMLTARDMQQPKLRDGYSENWQYLNTPFGNAMSDLQGDKLQRRMEIGERISHGEETKITMEKKFSISQRSENLKKLPPLLSLKSSDNLSTTLSLSLDSSDAIDSLTLQLATSSDTPETIDDKTVRVKSEQSEQCCQNFLGPNHHMGPFPSNSTKGTEEPITASSCLDPLHGARSIFSPTFRGRTEISAASQPEHIEFRDLLSPNYARGPFSSIAGVAKPEPRLSALDQSAGACTLEKVLIALERTQPRNEAAPNSVPTRNTSSDSCARPSCRVKPNRVSSLPPPAHPLLNLAAPTSSPTTSDASSAASSNSSRHSSTSPSVMSFQGEELDDLRGHGTVSDDSPPSQMVHFSYPTAQGNAASTLVAGGCMGCHIFVMRSKDNPNCPRCGRNGLLDILPRSSPSSPRKRQRLEKSKAGNDSRKSWDAPSRA